MSKKRIKTKPEVVEFKSKDSEINVNSEKNNDLAFGQGNYKFMLIGIAAILIGFFIMTLDKEEFGFGFLGITLGPIIVFCGFMIEIYAILKKKS